MSAKNVLNFIKDKEAEFVDLRFTDPRGKLQHLTMDSTVVDEDILKNVATNFSSSYVVGFAAETSDVDNNAMQKLKSKNLDMIISNDVSDKSIGFNVDDNEVNVITCDEKIFLKKDKKIRIAREILKIIANNTNN